MNEKCHHKCYHSDIKCHMMLNTIFCVVNTTGRIYVRNQQAYTFDKPNYVKEDEDIKLGFLLTKHHNFANATHISRCISNLYGRRRRRKSTANNPHSTKNSFAKSVLMFPKSDLIGPYQ